MSYDPNQYGQYQPNPDQPQSQYGQQYQPQPGQPGYGPQYQPQPGQPGYGPQYQPQPGQPGYGQEYQPQPEQPSYGPQYGQQYQPQQPQYQQQYQQQPFQQQYGAQQKDWLTTLLLCIFLGGIGVHRFYTGHTVIGVVQLLTAGGCGIWALVDLIMIITDNFKDSNGLPLKKA